MKFTALTTKAIRMWLKENDIECGCRLGGVMSYDDNDNCIYVGRVYDNECDYDFIKCLRGLGLAVDFDCITLSILHELGHWFTYNDFTDRQIDIYANAVERISNIEDSEKRNKKYWELRVEYVANVWAVEFANEHKKEVQALEDMIYETLA